MPSKMWDELISDVQFLVNHILIKDGDQMLHSQTSVDICICEFSNQQSLIGVKPLTTNLIHSFLWDIISHPLPDWNGSLVKTVIFMDD